MVPPCDVAEGHGRHQSPLSVATAANVADREILPDLLLGEETRVWATKRTGGRSRLSSVQGVARWRPLRSLSNTG